jgi:cytoskeletal protein RodZ
MKDFLHLHFLTILNPFFLINPASEVKAAISIFEKPHLSKSTELVWLSFFIFYAASLLILLFALNIKIRAVNMIRKKIRVESEKNIENNNYPSEKYDEPVSSSKTPCSSKPSKDEMVSNLSLFSRQSSSIESSNI